MKNFRFADVARIIAARVQNTHTFDDIEHGYNDDLESVIASNEWDFENVEVSAGSDDEAVMLFAAAAMKLRLTRVRELG